MDYFAPKFTLGMTATPDKRDDNIERHNIYEIFDHNIAYDIRLQQAMEEDLLCPFHYLGITDLAMISDEGTTKYEDRFISSSSLIAIVIRYVNEIEVSNSVLRERFGVDEKNKAIISRIIKETKEAGYIKLSDENAAPKMRRYFLYWV